MCPSQPNHLPYRIHLCPTALPHTHHPRQPASPPARPSARPPIFSGSFRRSPVHSPGTSPHASQEDPVTPQHLSLPHALKPYNLTPIFPGITRAYARTYVQILFDWRGWTGPPFALHDTHATLRYVACVLALRLHACEASHAAAQGDPPRSI